MARTDNLTNYLEDVATAIKNKKGNDTPIKASEFDTEIENLPSGGGNINEYLDSSLAQYSDTVTAAGAILQMIKKLPTLELSNVSNGNCFRNMFAQMNIEATPDIILPINKKAKTLQNLCYNCINLIDISSLANLDVSEVTSLNSTFAYANKLVDVSAIKNWNLSSLMVNFDYTFDYCESIKSIDLSNWDTSSIRSWICTFEHCTNLVEILGELDASNAESMVNTFRGCTNLETLRVKNLKNNATFSACPLSEESINYILNNVQDVTLSPKQMTLGTTNLSKASEKAKEHATNLGWNLL